MMQRIAQLLSVTVLGVTVPKLSHEDGVPRV